MKLKHTKVVPLAATLISIGSLAGGANAAVVFQVYVDSPTTINITASGTLDGPAPSNLLNYLWIDAPVGSPQLSLIPTGIFQVGSLNLGNSYVGYANPPYLNPIQLRFNYDLSEGDVFSFNGTLTSSSAHNLTNENLDGVNIYWGRNDLEMTVGTLQGQVSVIPEPSSALLLGFGALGILTRRRGC